MLRRAKSTSQKESSISGAGLGIGYLPESIVETYIKRGLMKRFPIEDPYADLRVVFIYRRHNVGPKRGRRSC